jgi:hypothetical protein
MIKQVACRAALVALGASLALGLSACEDPAAKAKAEADAAEKAKADEAERKAQAKIDHNVECLSALRWQSAALSAAGIGSLDIYREYYDKNLDEALGTRVITGKDGAPVLSRGSLEDYLKWAYANDVKTKFTAGKDNNADGKLSAVEHSGRGFNIVSSCVLEVAETGKGPLAGKDKVARMFRIQALQAQLKDKGE